MTVLHYAREVEPIGFVSALRSKAKSHRGLSTFGPIGARIDDLRHYYHSSNKSQNDESIPSVLSFVLAKEWLESFYQEIVSSNSTWRHPHIGLTPEGQVSFEWWNRDKSLTAYADEHGIEFLLTWKEDGYFKSEYIESHITLNVWNSFLN